MGSAQRRARGVGDAGLSLSVHGKAVAASFRTDYWQPDGPVQPGWAGARPAHGTGRRLLRHYDGAGGLTLLQKQARLPITRVRVWRPVRGSEKGRPAVVRCRILGWWSEPGNRLRGVERERGATRKRGDAVDRGRRQAAQEAAGVPYDRPPRRTRSR
jgi:hypothetical protein